jgi:hypothetical protein
VVSAESHVIDHGFEVAVQAEDHAPRVEFVLGAVARDLRASLGADIRLAAQKDEVVPFTPGAPLGAPTKSPIVTN